MLRRVRVLVVLASLVGALSAGAAGASAANWAGLGDSYAAGPLIPNQQLNPLGCLRSDRNFAHLAAASLGRSLADVSCSGAKTDDMTAPQDVTPGPANPPQFNALTADTQIVTLQIGGNDIGFTSILQNCATANPFAHPCRDKYVVNGRDTLADKIAATAPKVAAVLQGIHARSPDARVFVVNYAAILPETGSGCWPQVPIGFTDVPYLRGVEKNLNAMLAQQAAANGARIVDDYTASIGRDACRSATTRWVEPLVPGNAAAPFHPNARGEAGIAAVVARAVSS
jgi:lysophospholipase L1-like esterase